MNENLKSIGNIVQQALKPAREYNRAVQSKPYKPKKARFKMKIWWKNGGQFPAYSYDTYPKHIEGVKTMIYDESVGFTKLIAYINKNEKLIFTAVIWAKLSDDLDTNKGDYNCEIYKQVDQKERIFNPDVKFKEGRLVTEIIKIKKL